MIGERRKVGTEGMSKMGRSLAKVYFGTKTVKCNMMANGLMIKGTDLEKYTIQKENYAIPAFGKKICNQEKATSKMTSRNQLRDIFIIEISHRFFQEIFGNSI